MKTSIIMNTLDQTTNKKRKRSITNINPNATNEEMKNFSMAVVGLTNDLYLETERVDKINVDTEPTPTPSTLSDRETTVTDAAKNGTAKITFKRTETEASYGGVSLVVFYYNTQESTTEKLTTSSVSSGDPTIALYHVTIPNYNGRLYVGIEATEKFNSDFVKTTIS